MKIHSLEQLNGDNSIAIFHDEKVLKHLKLEGISLNSRQTKILPKSCIISNQNDINKLLNGNAVLITNPYKSDLFVKLNYKINFKIIGKRVKNFHTIDFPKFNKFYNQTIKL